ncbi:alpha/beta hydrolase [Coniochaeta sp. 2T2.1]|nr:alpha/beta hydrolase [Coniochaeta sp. 2T2.1]
MSLLHALRQRHPPPISRPQDSISTPNTDPCPPDRYNQTLTLPDGRTLAWAEAGDQSGYPFFFFHGFPGSRLEARGVEDIGRRHGIRFICPDRPGYGLSTFQHGRRITDWPSDVQHLARQLELKRYAVLGGSGGGPFALACARFIPKETVSGVGLLCTAAPWEKAVLRHVSWYRRLLAWAATYCPSLTTRVFNGLFGLIKWFAASSTGKKLLDNIAVKAAAAAGKDIPESETTPHAVAKRRKRLLSVLLEPFAQGSRALVQEAYLLSHLYGFRMEDVERKVQIWHGVEDTNSPIEMVRYMKEQLPDCDLHELEGETHFTIVKHLEEVVTELVRHR